MDYCDRFEPADSIYLLNHSVGRPPKGLRQQVSEAYFAPWERGATEPWEQWLAVIEHFRGALGRLFNARAGQFCPQVNLSGGLTKLLQSLPPRPGRPGLLLCEDDFPSMGFVLQQACRPGQALRFIPAGADASDPALWREYLDEEVDVALISHVHSNNGRQLPVAEIAAAARARGIVSVVDVAQSAGVLPIDLAAWGADFVLGSCVKWLCGGPGAGFLWADDRALQQCRPRDVGWFSHADPFAFDIHDFRYHPGAERFWGGTPSVLPYAAATVGVETIADIGVDKVRAHNLALSQRLIDAVVPGALVSPREASRRSGTVVLNFGERSNEVCRKLNAAGVAYDRRSQGLRLSPHVYNTEREIEVVVNCLPAIGR